MLAAIKAADAAQNCADNEKSADASLKAAASVFDAVVEDDRTNFLAIRRSSSLTPRAARWRLPSRRPRQPIAVAEAFLGVDQPPADFDDVMHGALRLGRLLKYLLTWSKATSKAVARGM